MARTMNTVVPLLARVTAAAAVVAPRAPRPAEVLVVTRPDSQAAIEAFAPHAIASTPADAEQGRRFAERAGAAHICIEPCSGDAGRPACVRPAAACRWPVSERLLHNPARRARDEAFYRAMGDSAATPCIDALTAGYRRNFAICASLARQVGPGERVVLVAISANDALLRQCISETPGLRLAD